MSEGQNEGNGRDRSIEIENKHNMHTAVHHLQYHFKKKNMKVQSPVARGKLELSTFVKTLVTHIHVLPSYLFLCYF